MDKKPTFYVTTPIYYATATPHLGTLYSTVLADVVARWHKIVGQSVFFLTGTDEFGQKVAQAAEKVGKTPQVFVDGFIPAYKDLWNIYHIDYSRFIRTTDSYHIHAVQQWILNLQAKGDIYKGAYEGWYCTPCETYLTEKDFEVGTKNPSCVMCQRPTEWVSEECYFFKLKKYQKALLDFYKNNPNFITPKERMAEVIAFVESGLEDLSISRTTLTWGVPFPNDTHHVTYVWADALNNYITGVGYGQPGREQEFATWWPADVQVLGKDIVRFHAIYWPAFLMASDLPLPHQLLVHGWIKVGEHKMSKSRGNSVDPRILYTEYGADCLRYYLVKQLAITQDGQFSIDDLEQKITSDLANDVGNLLQRMSVLAEKNNIQEVAVGQWNKEELDLQKKLHETIALMEYEMGRGYLHMAFAHLWKYVNTVNSYFHALEPWKVVKTDKERFATILSATCHSLYAVAVLAWPVMPEKMEELLRRLGVSFSADGIDFVEKLKNQTWNMNFVIQQGESLFKKPELREEAVNKIIEEVKQDPIITIDDVIKVDIRVGTIVTCENVEGSEKLVRSQVDFGELGMRQIFSGVRPTLTAEMLQGSQAIFIVNLKPRKMMGQESQGMMLVTKNDEHGIVPVRPTGAVPNGAKLS
jgi:methionyl-tRNA synthetase